MPMENAPESDGAVERLRAAVESVIRGKPEVVELTLVAVLAGGHVLLEDVPGVGKTTLARSLAGALGGSFRRVQFTSDLLPGDVIGVTVLGEGNTFTFRPGPLFANVVLADELNRTTPRTQSALLEAMSERQVSVDGVTHALPRPFVVVATQNPEELHGTYPLPDSQLDRFLVRLSMGYPDRESERAVLRAGGFRSARVEQAVSAAELAGLMAQVEDVAVHPTVEDYLLDLIDRTRSEPALVRGVSTRGAAALYRACQALALVRGRDFAVPEDVRELAQPVLAHRVLARADGSGAAAQALRAILASLPAP